MNLMVFEIFGFHEYSCDSKLGIVMHGMSDWLGNDGKRTWHNNFELRFLKKSLDLVRGFLFQFSLIWEVWLPLVIIWVKNDHFKIKIVDWPGIDEEMTSHSNPRLSASKRPWGADRGYIIIKCLVAKVKIVFIRMCVWIWNCVSNLCPEKFSSLTQGSSFLGKSCQKDFWLRVFIENKSKNYWYKPSDLFVF